MEDCLFQIHPISIVLTRRESTGNGEEISFRHRSGFPEDQSLFAGNDVPMFRCRPDAPTVPGLDCHKRFGSADPPRVSDLREVRATRLDVQRSRPKRISLNISYVCFIRVGHGWSIREPIPQIFGSDPLAIHPHSCFGPLTFSMVDVGGSTDVSNSLLLMEKGLSFLDVFFLSSHAETPS